MKTPIEEIIESILGLETTNIDELKQYLEVKIQDFLDQEKQVITLAHSHGISSHANHGIKAFASEQYYRETFNK